MESHRKNHTRTIVWCMKYIPFVGTLIMTAHCGALLLGYDLRMIDDIVGFSVSSTLMFMLLSRQFNFCILHKHLIGYVMLMQLCICLQEQNVFGRFLLSARLIMFAIGMALIIWSIIVYSRNKCGDEIAEK